MKKVLFLNHRQRQCGVYQYGFRSAMILKKSKRCNFMYFEISNERELEELVAMQDPESIIYNYVPATMPWLTSDVLAKFKGICHCCIHHEGGDPLNGAFDRYMMTDCTFADSGNRFSIPRPLFQDYRSEIQPPSIPTIGSFGFGFNNKGFERLVKLVNEEFDEATIRLHIPFAFYGDADGGIAKSIANACQAHMKKSGIKLSITHDFLTDRQVIDFLSGNTVNAFLYDEMIGRGLSSVIDYALSVRRPLAISRSHMFRHIYGTTPSICVENASLREIMNRKGDELKQYADLWSNENLIAKYEQIVEKENVHRLCEDKIWSSFGWLSNKK